MFSELQGAAVQTGNRLLTPLVPPPGGSRLDAEGLREAVLGLVLGAVVGDTLGQLTQGMEPQEAAFHYCRDNLALVGGAVALSACWN